MELSTARSIDMNYIQDLYMESFPKEERKPFSVIERKAAMGTMEILLLTEGHKRVGFAITAMRDDLVLLDYFVIDPQYREKGYGSEALELLRELYSGNQFYLEIERPDEEAEDPDPHVRRADGAARVTAGAFVCTVRAAVPGDHRADVPQGYLRGVRRQMVLIQPGRHASCRIACCAGSMRQKSRITYGFCGGYQV